MEVFKAKSLVAELSDEQIKNNCFTTSFISFERAIAEILEIEGNRNKYKGYRVTSQGIEIIWE